PRDRRRRLVLLRNAEIRSEVEELVLDGPKRGAQILGDAARGGQADLAVELVDGAVGLDAQGILRDAPAGAEARRAVVAGPRVDLRDSRHQNLTSSPPATSLPAAGSPSASSYRRSKALTRRT